MKKLLKLLGIIALAAVIGFIVSCGGGGGGGPGITTPPGDKPGDPPVTVPECDHNWSDWLVIYIPAETVIGAAVPMTEKRTCSICGETQTRSTTTFTPTVIINLTTRDVTGETNTASAPDITISPAASAVILIIGDGTNGGTGRSVTINNAQKIYIADGAVFGNILQVPNGGTITGGGTVNFTSNSPCISAGDSLTISGTIGNMTSPSAPVIYTSPSDLTITGMIGGITSSNNGIWSGNVIISGAIGAITSSGSNAISGNSITISGAVGDIKGNVGINSSTNIIISGTAGDITGSSGPGMYSASADITISGTTGNIISAASSSTAPGILGRNIKINGRTGIIKGGDNPTGSGGVGISSSGTVEISGTVGSNAEDDIMGGLGLGGIRAPKITVNSIECTGWPTTRTWP